MIPFQSSKQQYRCNTTRQNPKNRECDGLLRLAAVCVELSKHMQTIRTGLCLVASLLFVSCKTSKPAPVRASTSISLDKTAVKLGDEIRINLTRPLQGWSGEATINTFRATLPIDSQNNVVRATRENGFSTLAPTEICVALKDAAGRDVTVSNRCVRVSVSSPLYHLQPESGSVSSSGGSGRIEVEAPPQEEVNLGNVPDWITAAKVPKLGVDEIRYEVAENPSYKVRSAAIMIGDARFELTQWGSPYVSIPFTADFTTVPIAVWELVGSELKIGKSHDAPPEWVLDDQPNQNATVAVSRDGPSGKSALIVERPLNSHYAWMTMVCLPGIRTEDGGKYTVSVWLKAEFAAQIGLEFGQRTDPHDNCGLFQLVDAGTDWKQVKAHFKASGRNCGADNNRFMIQAGRVLGKLWISGFTLTKE